ncbi:MAG TPA: hypothetical protein VN039_12400 [Nitrospira sp.]|nr:hypothetical protein [Nitrospira sp.]
MTAIATLQKLEEFARNMQYYEFHGSIPETTVLNYRDGYREETMTYRIGIIETECGRLVTFRKADSSFGGCGLIQATKPEVINVYEQHELLPLLSTTTWRAVAQDFAVLKDSLDMAITGSARETTRLLEEAHMS